MSSVWRSRTYGRVATLAFLVECIAPTHGAADAVDVYAQRAIDVTCRLSYQQIGQRRAYVVEGEADADLTSKLSVFGRGSLASAHSLGNPSSRVLVGASATAFRRAHVDLDGVLSVSLEGGQLDRVRLAPGLALNWDHTRARSAYGAYLRSGLSLVRHLGGARSSESISASARLVPGAYLKLRHRHRLSAEYDMSVGSRNTPRRALRSANLSLGYSLALTAELKLITQAQLNVPKRGTWAGALTWGFTAQLRRAH